MPRTRSQSGIHQIRKPEPSFTPSSETRPVRRAARRVVPDKRNIKEDLILRKPKYLSPTTPPQAQGSRRLSKAELMARLEKCAELITPTIDRISPAMKAQVSLLRKFDVFKTLEIETGTLKVLLSGSCDMSERDKKLELIMQLQGVEQQRALEKFYGLKSSELEERLKKEEEADGIEELSLNN